MKFSLHCTSYFFLFYCLNITYLIRLLFSLSCNSCLSPFLIHLLNSSKSSPFLILPISILSSFPFLILFLSPFLFLSFLLQALAAVAFVRKMQALQSPTKMTKTGGGGGKVGGTYCTCFTMLYCILLCSTLLYPTLFYSTLLYSTKVYSISVYFLWSLK